MEHIRLKKYYILELIIIILFTGLFEFVNLHYYVGVFKNYTFLVNMILICVLIRGLLIRKYSISLIKVNIAILMVTMISAFIVLPEYNYKDANKIVLEEVRKKDMNASISENIEYKSIIGKYTPSAFVSRWYSVKMIENRVEEYYYFNPESGEFFKGEKRKNSNSGITNMPNDIK